MSKSSTLIMVLSTRFALIKGEKTRKNYLIFCIYSKQAVLPVGRRLPLVPRRNPPAAGGACPSGGFSQILQKPLDFPRFSPYPL
jgi:hypothetical protein